MRRYLIGFVFTVASFNAFSQVNIPRPTVVLKGINLIDGTGAAPQQNVSLVIKGDTIVSVITDSTKPLPKGAHIITLRGKTLMPEIYDINTCLGITQDTSTGKQYYTAQNIERQLKKYVSYGVGAVLSMGTDQDLIFKLRDSSHKGLLPDDPLVFTAGYGFGAPNGEPSDNISDKIFRPATPAEAASDMRQLRTLRPDVIKLWVDDVDGKYPAMKPEIYKVIIEEAHRYHWRVAASVFHYQEAGKLIAAGVDVLTRSIGDRVVDDKLVLEMRKKGVYYMPALAMDYYNIAFTSKPSWLDDPMFTAALEPGVLNMLTGKKYQANLRKDYTRNKAIYDNAIANAKKMYKGGVLILLGPGSGEKPVDMQGFSEQMEMQLLAQAGLTPLDVISCATKNGAEFLRIGRKYGALTPGMRANFIVLNQNPATNIRGTASIESVWQNGRPVSRGAVQERKREERRAQDRAKHGK